LPIRPKDGQNVVIVHAEIIKNPVRKHK